MNSDIQVRTITIPTLLQGSTNAEDQEEERFSVQQPNRKESTSGLLNSAQLTKEVVSSEKKVVFMRNSPAIKRLEEIVDTMLSSQNIESYLTSTFKYLIAYEITPIYTLHLIRTIESIKEQITSTNIQEEDKRELMELNKSFRGLLNKVEKEEKEKGFGGAFPRYYWLSILFFETKLKNITLKIEEATKTFSELNGKKQLLTQKTKETNNTKQIQKEFEEEKTEKLKKANKYKQDLQELQQFTQSTLDDLEKYSKLLESARSDKDEIIKSFEDAQKGLENAKNSIEDNRNEIKKLEQQDYEHNLKIKQIEEKWALGDQTKDKLELLELEIQEFSEKILERENVIKELNGIYNGVKEEEKKAKKLVTFYSQKHEEEFSQENSAIERITKEIQDRYSSITNLEEKFQFIKTKDNENQRYNGIFVKERKEDTLEAITQEIEQTKMRHQKWEEELRLIEHFKEKIKMEKNSIIELLEENRIEKEGNEALERKQQELEALLNYSKNEFEIHKKETKSNIKALEGEILELDWRNSKGKNKSSGHVFVKSFLITVFVCFLFICFIKLPKGTLIKFFDL